MKGKANPVAFELPPMSHNSSIASEANNQSKKYHQQDGLQVNHNPDYIKIEKKYSQKKWNRAGNQV